MNVWALVQEWNAGLPLMERRSIRSRLAHYLNQLLLNDFGSLVQLLYRVDVSEARVKTVLRQNSGVDAGELLTDLLLERIEEKKKTLQAFRTPPPESDEERW
ncbi:MAG TPA: hypothetical protein VGN63_04700 [Flavisolibacter sp.]|jgi:hypothetical protein|nr:hypothetical protein [Flavisolibacter sp.]